MRVPQAPKDRLPREGESMWSKSAKQDYVIDENGCWIWQKSKLAGYGLCSGGRAHRIYYERANGPIPEGHDVHHLCYVPACVNPAHLEAMSEREHDIESFLRANGRDLDFVRQVREEGRKVGASILEIAERYGINQQTVQNWWNNRHWEDVFGDEGPVVTPRYVCHLDGCDNVCEGYRHKRYCCPAHRGKANHQKRKARLAA